MSTLTKVFTVLLVVFSIAFTSMTVSIVAQTTNWRDTAMVYQQRAQVADTNLRNQIAASAAELATVNEVIRTHLSSIGELQSQLRAQEGQMAQVRGESARLTSEKSSAEAINRGLLAQLESTEKARQQYQQQRDDLEYRNIDLERRNIDLNDRVNEQTARIAVLLEQKRQLEQQVNLLQSDNRRLTELSRRGGAGPALESAEGLALAGVEARTPPASEAIRGEVLDVDGEIVTISVGAVNGVQPDMVFIVHRGERYVGDLKVSKVDPERSAGRPAGPRFTPLVGDLVTDAVRFGAGSR